MRPRSTGDGGAGLLATVAGVLVFLTFLLFTVEVLFGLYASSTVTAVTNDAVTRAAADAAPPLRHVEADARRNLGAVGAGADFRWELDDTDGDGAADTVVLDVVAHPPRFLPPGLGGLLGPVDVHRRARARARGAPPVSVPSARRLRGDHGQVGGIEAIPFGLLVFVVGTLLIANAWAVIDAKFATDAAARQAARTFVEGSDPGAARHDALGAARAAIAGHGRDPDRARVESVGSLRLERCARATFVVSYEIPAVSIPFVGGFGGAPFRVRSTHSELVDPFRSGLPGDGGACV